MLKKKNRKYKQIQLESSLIKEIKKLAVEEEVKIRVLASGLLEYALADESKIQEIIKKIKMMNNG